MKLLIRVQGATDLDLQRGTAAAQQVFERAGASASDCALAASTRNSNNGPGSVAAGRKVDRERLARLWDEAEQAGIEACCSGKASIPEHSCLELRFGDTRKAKARR